MSNEYMISFDANKCVACHACVVSCKTWRNLALGVRYRRVEKIWSGDFPKTTLSHVVVACQHCLEPACLAACPAGAISKEAKTGRVLADSEKCIGCRACADACPYGVPQFSAEGETMQKCDLCLTRINPVKEQPPCVKTCPTQALALTRVTPALKQKEQEKIIDLLNRV